MLNFVSQFSDERLRSNFVITQEIFDFLNDNFKFLKLPKGFLVAKMQKPHVQITVHFPDHFNIGQETSLLYWTHTNPYNTVEHRFSFTPPVECKPQNSNIQDFFDIVNNQLAVCDDWREKINYAFALPEFVEE
jgi:hypothetical protein